MFSFIRKRSGAAVRLAGLDALGTNVMVADAEMNIIYVNAALTALLREVEAELRQELPHFSVDTLVGSNIDVFHRNPAHQRRMLAGLETTHRACIHVGRLVFDLVVTPLRQQQQRIGYVVEWTDAAPRLLNVDYASQIAAFSRAEAMIEFTPDGTIVNANENFLRTLGYTLAEVQGKHHGMFVPPAQRDTEDYATFWERLRRGEYQAAQFKRITKDGREIWIEGAYNPILDAGGRVAKVVKFATDISAQKKLLSDLKGLIDTNFGEIDGAIGLSTTEAQSAASAAAETSSNVASVAASAEELAASIAEISQSMAQSRAATENAFEQTVAVGRSTETLAGAARAMGGIVELIRDVASQINLLALNATIEAARAGDAGKGFAVVASEVKNLAIQAARATEQISSEIDGIQSTSTNVAGALGAIREAVTTVRGNITLAASAVEEQSAVTRGMSSAMQTASDAVTTVTMNIGEIASAVQQAAQAVSKTKEAAKVLAR